MSSVSPSCPNHAEWRIPYRTAILETKRSVILRKVSEAEIAMLARQRELFYGGGTIDEKESLEDALYLLRVYRSIWENADEAKGIANAAKAPAASARGRG